jgi:hypothetical protein
MLYIIFSIAILASPEMLYIIFSIAILASPEIFCVNPLIVLYKKYSPIISPQMAFFVLLNFDFILYPSLPRLVLNLS